MMQAGEANRTIFRAPSRPVFPFSFCIWTKCQIFPVFPVFQLYILFFAVFYKIFFLFNPYQSLSIAENIVLSMGTLFPHFQTYRGRSFKLTYVRLFVRLSPAFLKIGPLVFSDFWHSDAKW